MVLLGVVLFGSLWGLSEATFGALLHLINSPYKGEIMTSFGVMVMSAAAAVYKPKNAFAFTVGLGVVASLVKGVNLIFLGVDSHVLRVMVVIPIEAASFGALASIFNRAFNESRRLRPAVGALSAYASFFLLSSVYIYAGIGSNFWVGRGFADMVSFTLSGGTVAAILSVLTTDVGFRLGETVKPAVEDLIGRDPAVYYLVSVALTALSWILRVSVA